MQKRRMPQPPRNTLPLRLQRSQKRRVLRRPLLRNLATRLCGQAPGDAPQHIPQQIHPLRRTRMLPQQRLGRKGLRGNASLSRGIDVVRANQAREPWCRRICSGALTSQPRHRRNRPGAIRGRGQPHLLRITSAFRNQIYTAIPRHGRLGLASNVFARELSVSEL